uniref:Clathrin/coatomer adaptor adaptin-like N-terminal domain-containing protein n=1 Tax=Arcella intermedia TaxID=1963864 RepID=A0A6B2KXX4_9EUKA
MESILKCLMDTMESSPKLQNSILQALQFISSSKNVDWHRVNRVVIHLLSKKDPTVRALALRFLATRSKVNLTNLQSLLGEFSQDSDPRVRTVALKGFETSHQRGGVLDSESLYEFGILSLNDDDLNVRVEGIKFLWIMANLYPHRVVQIKNQGPKVTLVNYVFQKICSCLYDTSSRVRAMACALLGTLQHVDSNLLLQALSKRIINTDEPEKEDEEGTDFDAFQGNEKNVFGEAVSSNSDILILNDTSLNANAAAGAFVHGLEDEFMAVRSATIDSICEVSLRSLKFCSRAIAPLVDMFNDEIDTVRINAMNSLRKLGSAAKFTEEQTQIILSGLEESQQNGRFAVHLLIRSTQLTSTQCLTATIQALLLNLSKYPQDVDSIFQCSKCLGLNHPAYAALITEDLLRLDSRFIPRESNISDLPYVTIMIMLFNAASKNSAILTILPPYANAHYNFMKDKYSKYIPTIEQFSFKISLCDRGLYKEVTNEGHGILQNLVSKISSIVFMVNNNKFQNAINFIQSCKTDFLKISKLDKLTEDKYQFYIAYLKCLKFISKARLCSPSHLSYTKLTIKLISKTYDMEHAYLGLSKEVLLQIYIMRLYSNLMFLLNLNSLYLSPFVPPTQGTISPSQNISTYESSLVSCLKRISEYCKKYDQELPSLYSGLTTLDMGQVAVDVKQMEKALVLNPINEKNLIKKVYAEISEPTPNFETPAEFHYFLSKTIQVKAVVYNTDNISNLVIQVLFPDNTKVTYPITRPQVKPLGPLTIQICSDINIKCVQPWNEKCYISISIGLVFPPTDCIFSPSITNDKDLGFVKLSGDLLFYIYPKAK